jgi:hypothetical protein
MTAGGATINIAIILAVGTISVWRGMGRMNVHRAGLITHAM